MFRKRVLTFGTPNFRQCSHSAARRCSKRCRTKSAANEVQLLEAVRLLLLCSLESGKSKFASNWIRRSEVHIVHSHVHDIRRLAHNKDALIHFLMPILTRERERENPTVHLEDEKRIFRELQRANPVAMDGTFCQSASSESGFRPDCKH